MRVWHRPRQCQQVKLLGQVEQEQMCRPARVRDPGETEKGRGEGPTCLQEAGESLGDTGGKLSCVGTWVFIERYHLGTAQMIVMQYGTSFGGSMLHINTHSADKETEAQRRKGMCPYSKSIQGVAST